MSGIGSQNVASLLPEDVEAKLAKIQETISILEGKIISLNNEVESKKLELNISSSHLQSIEDELSKKKLEVESISSSLIDREVKISQKESALDVYANALQEKEKKINKYLAIFENMKDVVG